MREGCLVPDAEPTFEGGCRDVVAGLTAMPGVTVPANYCSDSCSRSCYGGLWFNSPCMTDSEVIHEFAHSGPALFTVQIHCSVPWRPPAAVGGSRAEADGRPEVVRVDITCKCVDQCAEQ